MDVWNISRYIVAKFRNKVSIRKGRKRLKTAKSLEPRAKILS